MRLADLEHEEPYDNRHTPGLIAVVLYDETVGYNTFWDLLSGHNVNRVSELSKMQKFGKSQCYIKHQPTQYAGQNS